MEQAKFDSLIASLSDRLGTDATAVLWVRAERRLGELIGTAVGLSKGEKQHVEGNILPTCALYEEMSLALGKHKGDGWH